MKNPNFKEIATAGDLRLVYRQYYGNKHGYTIAMGNCILWNGQEESLGLDLLQKFSEMNWGK